MTFIERLKLAYSVLTGADALEPVISKIEALSGVLSRLEGIQGRLPESSVLESLASRLETLDSLIQKLEAPHESVSVHQNGEQNPPIKEDIQEWNRLKLLSKFVHLSGKAKEIELEWQRIQQDEHDFQFAFQTTPNEETQSKYIYKKGIADGIKWCIDRFN